VSRVQQAFMAALAAHGSTPLLSFRFRHRDGSYRILEGRGNNLLEHEAVGGIVFNSRDVTEQRRLEEQYRQSQKVQAIGQLTGGVAHDFNNILTAIIGYGDLALQSAQGYPLLTSQIEEMRKAALRAASLTRQLLAFSRKQVLLPQVLSLESITADMDKMLRRLLGAQIDLATVVQPDVGNVLADLNQVEQVLLNLAVNARDALEKTSDARMTIDLRNAEVDEMYAALRSEFTAGEYVVMSISDNGCGMPPEVQARLFEPFFTTKGQGKGTGLGLATCHGIVKQSGGYISVYSEEGNGTTFRVFWPRIREEAAKIVHPVDTPSVAAGTGTVLLVEDEPMLRELGSTVLQELGYQVVLAENGLQAFDMVTAPSGLHFDLILTDIVMPGMGGRELVEKLRALRPQLRVVYCSGYTEDAIFHTGQLEPNTFFLQKPYTIAAVAQKVDEAMRSGQEE
jgi:signal transduction histidine kinase/ActR/RegA family two-component response regulator